MRRYTRYFIASFVLLISVWLILLRAQYAGVAINHWTPTADMAFARAAACSALLPDGRVLVAGGNSSSGVVNTAELYGANGTFALASPMAQARAGAACTTMQNGTVLVTGGNDGTSALASSEIYDPVADAWTPAGAMSVARTGHTAMLTPWGAVLIVGGQSNGSVSSVVELFLMNGQFLTVGNLSSPRQDYALAALPGRQVLIAGGSDGNSALATIDLFNADTNAISPAGTMLVARTNFAMAALLDGTVLITGGYGAHGNVLASSEVYDPVKQVSTDGPQLPVSRANHQAYILPNNGRVILVGGSTDGSAALTATDVFEPWTGQFAKTAPLNMARSGNASSLLQRGALIVAGGRNGSGYLTSSEVYGFATIATDKDDYAPGTPVVMTGSGWKPGEQVLVQVTAFPLDQHKVEFTGAAVADGTGQIKLTGFQVDKSHLGVRFLADAMGSQSRAQALFSDNESTSINNITVNPNGPNGPTSYPVSLRIQGTVANTSTATDYPLDASNVGGANVLFAVDGTNVGGAGVGLDPSANFDSGASLFNLLTPGPHSITVSWAFGGSAACLGATCNGSSNTFTYNVTPLTTSISNLGGAGTILYGGSTMLSAEVDVTGPGSATYYPNGLVTFSDGTNHFTCGLPVLASPNNHCSVSTGTTLSPGIHNFTVTYAAQTQFAASSAGPIVVNVDPAASTTTLTASATSPQPYGTAFTLTATVAPPQTAGFVTFYDGAIAISSALSLLPVGGNMQVTINAPTTLTVGLHHFHADYAGNVDYVASSGTLDFTITQANTSTTVTSSVPSGTQAFGNAVTFTATVVNLAGGPNPTGTVTFKDTATGAVVGTANVALSPTVANTSTAAVTVSNLLCTNCFSGLPPNGAHIIRAYYTPTSNAFQTTDSSTTGDYTYTVTPAMWPITGGTLPPFNITVSPNPLTLGGGITVTVSASPAELAGVMPTGNVTLFFSTHNASGGTFPLVNGIATHSYSAADLVSLIAAPSVNISLDYLGDDQYFGYNHDYSTPGYFTTLTVNKAATTGYMSSVPVTPVYYGNLVTYVANISSTYSGSITGTASFFDGLNAVLCGPSSATTVPVTSGVAQCVPNPLPTPGTHPIYATWTGDTVFAPGGVASANAYSLVVNPETTSVALTPSTTNTTLTTTVIYTAVVSGSPVTPTGGGGTLGHLDFYDVGSAADLCPNVSLTAGSATCSVPYTGGAGEGAGTHLVYAVYTAPTTGPNANDFAGSTSPQVSVVVNKGAVTISAVASTAGTGTPLTYAYGTPTDLSVTLTPVNPTPGYNGTNTVQFFDGATSLGYGTLTVATSTFTLPAQLLAAGSHNIHAQFLGDTNYAASASTPILNIVVTKATPVLALTGGPAYSANYGGQILTVGPITVPKPVGSGAGTLFATGTVTLTAGPSSVQIGTPGTLNGSGQVTFINAQLPTSLDAYSSPQSLVITYNGDSNYASAQYTATSTTLSVSPATPTGTLATSGTPSANGASVTFTLTLGPAASPAGSIGTPSGTVNFFATDLSAVTPLNPSPVATVGGVAQFTTTTLPPGAHTITAAYTGAIDSFGGTNKDFSDTTFTLNTTGGLQTVSAVNTTTTLTPSTSTPSLNSSVIYTATVTSTYGTPTGTVDFKDVTGAAIVLCPTVALVSGVAQCTVTYTAASGHPELAAGTHLIQAFYNNTGATATWNTSNSAQASITVGKASITMSALSITACTPATPCATAPPYTYGETLTVSTTITPNNPAPPYSANIVHFYDGATDIGSSSVNTTTGVASLAIPVSVLTAGTHSITADFIGDANYNADPTPVLTITILKATLTVAAGNFTVVGSPYSAPYGGQMPLTTPPGGVTVTGVTGGTVPSGTITLTAAASQIGNPLVLTAGATTFTGAQLPASLQAGPGQGLTLTYSGDTNYNSAVVTGSVINVTTTTPTTSLVTSGTPSDYHALVTFTLTLAPPAGDVGVPAGTVDFFADGSAIPLNTPTSVVVNSSGVASYTTGALTPGVHSITATYTGAVNVNSSLNFASVAGITLAGINQTVRPAVTTTVLTPSTYTPTLDSTVVYTATVTGGASTPQGTITFTDATYGMTIPCSPVNPVPLVAGSASCSVTYDASNANINAAGAHNITATFNTNDATQWATSTSIARGITVGKAPVTMGPVAQSVASTCTPAQCYTYAAVTTLSVSLAPVNPTPAYSAASVQFLDAGVILPGTVTLNAGTSTFSLAGVLLAAGTHNITAQFLGDANYNAASPTAILVITVNKATPTVTAASDPATAQFGRSFTTPTVTVTGVTGGTTPTGTISLSSGATAIGSPATLSSGTVAVTAVLPVSILPGAMQAFQYSYSGDSNYLAANSGTNYHITVSQTAIPYTITSSTVAGYPAGQYPPYGQPIVLTATFAGLTGAPANGGAVNFIDGVSTTVCTAVPIVNNVATCTVPPASAAFAVGSHTITLGSFSDTNYTISAPPASTALSFTVVKAPTTIAFSPSPNPVSSVPGQQVTFYATVAVPSPGAATPTGGVVFTEDTTGGPVTLCSSTSPQALVFTGSAYVATCVFVAPAFTVPGTYTIHASYVTDANTAASTVVLPYTVNKVQPVIALVSSIPGPSPNPVYGQPITYTVTVSPAAGTTLQPTAGSQVTFYDGANQLIGTTVQPLAGPSGGPMTASVTVSNTSNNLLTVGTHAITAFFGGDANYSSITSAILYQTVVAAGTGTGGDPTGTSVTVTFTGGGPVYGQPVTLTARVTALYNGKPTGTVTFTDAGTGIPGAVATLVLCTPVLPATTCNYSTATITLPSGSLPGLSTTIPPAPLTALAPHTIGAVYSGDGNFAVSSAAPPTSQAISAANTTTTVTSLTTTTAAYGQSPVILAAQVLPVAPGAGTRVGTISFYDGSLAHLLGTSGPVDASGTAQIQVSALAASGFQNVGTTNSIIGQHYIIAVYNSASGTPSDPNFNPSTSGPTAFTINISLTATLTSVVSSSSPTSVYSQPVTFTATVGNTGTSFGTLPTGTVTFTDGTLSTTLGTVTLVNSGGAMVATLTLPNATGGLSLGVGNHVISVSYSGDANHAASTTPAVSPLVQTVIQANTTSTLSTTCSNATGCVVGQVVTLTASVTVNAPGVNAPIPGTTAAPTGTVQFFNGTTVLGSAPASLLVAGGSSASPTYTATLTTTLPQGNLQLTSVYSGDVRYATSTSAILTQGINTIAVTVVVNPNYSSVTYGTPVQFTVTVTPVNTAPPPVPGTLPTPTGLVTFFDGGAALCSGVQLSGGTAVCNPAGPLAVGTHAVSVQYTPTQDQTGNVNYQPNVSASTALVVNKIPTSLSLSASFTQGYAGQPITFTAQVVANPASGVPYAGGQVSFYDGSYVTSTNILGYGTLISGIATLQPSVNLTPGLHQILAIYNGDTYYTGSQSGFAPVTINVASTTTQISSSVNPSVVGQTVVFTITVGVTYPSTFGPNGQVQLWDNSMALGSPVSANNGTFTISVPGLTPGTHNIFATFLASGSFGTSTSSTLTQIVNKAPTVTTLAALPLSSTSSQQVVLTAVVSVTPPGSGTPTGTVQFVDTTFNKILGSAPLTMIGGVYTATITTNQMVQSGAPQLLTATYSGDANFATSTSVPQGQTVFGSQVTVTNAASYYSSNFAPDSWATAWGSSLSTSTLLSSTSPLPTSLAGTTVQVTDAAGVARLAPLSFVSMGQINFMIPTNTAAGLATVTVTNAYGATASTIIVVSPTSPGLFSQDSSGTGLAAGQYQVVHSDGSQTAPAQIAQYNTATGQWVPVPIVAAATDQVYLILYGTGIRYKPSNGSVTATVNGQSATVAYAGPQAQYFGEDQVNLGPLTGLTGAGTVNVQITVNGEPSNTVTVNFQ